MVRKVSRRMRRNPMTKMMRMFTTKRGMTSGMRRRMVKKMTRGSPDVEEEKEGYEEERRRATQAQRRSII